MEKRLALIQEGILPMYGQPEPHQTITDEALYGMACEIMDEKDEYAYIRMEYGYTGWVRKSGLYEGQWPTDREMLRVMKRQLDVMVETKVNCEILATMPMGSVVMKAEKEYNRDLKEGWICVCLVDGRRGYTKTSYFEPYIPLSWDGPQMEESVFRSELMRMVKMYEGTHYRWGGKSPMGIDCSGLCSMAYLLCGVVIHRDAGLKPEFCLHEIERKDLKAGDLIFFPGHVAMYLGGERQMYIHSTAKAGSDGVDYNSLKADDPLYREDLDRSITELGSVYPLHK